MPAGISCSTARSISASSAPTGRRATGDVCNKIGTYLKALAAQDNGVPFYVALPSSTIDWRSPTAAAIPIEQRSDVEVPTLTGRATDGRYETIRLVPEGSAAANYAFDVTPARLVTGLITERGVRGERSRAGGPVPGRG